MVILSKSLPSAVASQKMNIWTILPKLELYQPLRIGHCNNWESYTFLNRNFEFQSPLFTKINNLFSNLSLIQNGKVKIWTILRTPFLQKLEFWPLKNGPNWKLLKLKFRQFGMFFSPKYKKKWNSKCFSFSLKMKSQKRSHNGNMYLGFFAC